MTFPQGVEANLWPPYDNILATVVAAAKSGPGFVLA